MLDALGVVSAVVIQMTAHVQAQIGRNGRPMGHQAFPGAIHVQLVLGSTIDLLDVAVDAHLVQHVGDSGEHIGDGADGDDVSSEAVSIASLSHQLLGTVGIILEVVDVVVVGHSTGTAHWSVI